MNPSRQDVSAGRSPTATADAPQTALQREARRLAERHIELLRLTSKWLRDINGPTIGDQVAADLHHQGLSAVTP